MVPRCNLGTRCYKGQVIEENNDKINIYEYPFWKVLIAKEWKSLLNPFSVLIFSWFFPFAGLFLLPIFYLFQYFNIIYINSFTDTFILSLPFSYIIFVAYIIGQERIKHYQMRECLRLINENKINETILKRFIVCDHTEGKYK
jgi:hypothetical protein